MTSGTKERHQISKVDNALRSMKLLKFALWKSHLLRTESRKLMKVKGRWTADCQARDRKGWTDVTEMPGSSSILAKNGPSWTNYCCWFPILAFYASIHNKRNKLLLFQSACNCNIRNLFLMNCVIFRLQPAAGQKTFPNSILAHCTKASIARTWKSWNQKCTEMVGNPFTHSFWQMLITLNFCLNHFEFLCSLKVTQYMKKMGHFLASLHSD